MPHLQYGYILCPQRQAIKLAKALEENPTPQVANMVINRLHETNSPQAAQFEDLIKSVINDPVALSHLAQSVIRYFSETE